MTKDLYGTLGVDRKAKPDEIQRAYRKRAAKAHPDTGAPREDFEALVLARDTLLDPESRLIYDQTGQTPHDKPELPAAVILIRNLAVECAAKSQTQNLLGAIREALIAQKQAAQSAARKYQASIDQVTKRWHEDDMKAQVLLEFDTRRRAMEGQVRVVEAAQAMLKDSKYDGVDVFNPLMGSPFHGSPRGW